MSAVDQLLERMRRQQAAEDAALANLQWTGFVATWAPVAIALNCGDSIEVGCIVALTARVAMLELAVARLLL